MISQRIARLSTGLGAAFCVCALLAGCSGGIPLTSESVFSASRYTPADEEPLDPPLPDTRWWQSTDHLQIIGVQFDSQGEVEFVLHGVAGAMTQDDQPEGGATGYVHWHGAHHHEGHTTAVGRALDSEGGFWLVRFHADDGHPDFDFDPTEPEPGDDGAHHHLANYHHLDEDPFDERLGHGPWWIEEGGNELIGLMRDEQSGEDFIVHGIRGRFLAADWPAQGTTGYVHWEELHEHEDGGHAHAAATNAATRAIQMGFWLARFHVDDGDVDHDFDVTIPPDADAGGPPEPPGGGGGDHVHG